MAAQTVNVVVVGLALVLCCCCVSVTLAGLCDVCNCSKDDEMKSVDCRCKGNSQTFGPPHHVVDEDRDGDIISLTVSDCHQVVVGLNSTVSQLPMLQTFKVVRSANVMVEAGFAGRMDVLVLEDVGLLELEPGALQGDSLRMLQLDRVYVRTLPKRALADVTRLQSLMLRAVNISHVQAKAVRLAMDRKSEIIIENSHLGTVESRGVLVTSVDSFSMVRSSLDAVLENGINVTARQLVLVDRSSFGADLSSHGLCTTAQEVNITGNSFSSLPDGLLAKNTRHLRPGQRLYFADNLVAEQGLLDVPDVALGRLDEAVTYVGNSFECRCDDKHLVENLQKLLESGFSGMLEHNFCATRQCPKQVSHAMLLRHLQSKEGATCAQEELCKLRPTVTTTERPRQTYTTTTTTVKAPHINTNKKNGGGRHKALPLAFILVAFILI